MATSFVNNKYRITRRIGGGSFGEIYMGIGPNNEKVAVKFERHGCRCPQLRHEYKVYRELANCHGFCAVYHFGQQDNYNVMVMDLLGPSLEDLFNKCQRRFSLKTVLQLADQMLERVDTLHSRHLIHRDIKPANFVIGLGDQGANVYCVDFGLSKRYRHPKSLQHIPHRDGRSLTGTPRYASINNHLGIEQSRRDDLESIGYVLIYFLKGSLPWQGLKAKNAQKKYRMILEKKQQVSIAQLCQGCPSQFAEFLAYSRSMKFDAKPDIPYIRKLLRDLYHAQGCASVGKLWDWDHIDTDFMTTGAGSESEGGPPVLSNPLRPSTGAAINGGEGHGDDGDMGTHEDMHDEDFGGRGGGKERPASSGALPSASAKQPTPQQQQLLSSSWGFSRQQQPMGGSELPTSSRGMPEYGMGTGIADPSQKRPHTAHGGRVPGQPTASTQDLRKPAGGPGSLEQDEDADAHVVAGARAMMRYRRTRATDGSEGSGVPAQQLQQQAPNPGRGTWTGDAAAQQSAATMNRIHYMGQQQGQQPAGRTVSAGAVGSTSAGAIGGASQAQLSKQSQQQYIVQRDKAPTSSGWLGSSMGSGAIGTDRPKSAGLMSTLTGSGAAASTNRNSVGAAVPQQTTAATGGSNTLSYGSLKNRFLSGTKTKSSNMFSFGN